MSTVLAQLHRNRAGCGHPCKHNRFRNRWYKGIVQRKQIGKERRSTNKSPECEKSRQKHKLTKSTAPQKPWTILSSLEDMNIIDKKPGWCLSSMESKDVITSSRHRKGVICPGTVTRCNGSHHIVISFDVDERVLFEGRTTKSAVVEERDGVLLPCDCRERRGGNVPGNESTPVPDPKMATLDPEWA